MTKMIKITQIAMIAVMAVVTSSSFGADKPAAGKMIQVVPDDKQTLMPYWLYLPKEYDANKDKLPVVLFLHGLGERGDNLKRLAGYGPAKLIANGKHFPFIMIAPQCPNDGKFGDKKSNPRPKEFWWMPGSVDKVKNIIDHEKKRLGRVDDDRVYVTGLSMGGFGAYNIVNRHPETFAAAVPICGHGNPWPDKSNIVHIPFWAFHGDQDKTVSLKSQQETVDALKAAGASVKFTIYKGVGHNSWTKTYSNPEMYKWMLDQKRKPAKK
jgi:predicted peptidase